MVGPYKTVKISDFGMCRSVYRNDYFKSQAGCLLPIRWMAWESVLLVRPNNQPLCLASIYEASRAIVCFFFF